MAKKKEIYIYKLFFVIKVNNSDVENKIKSGQQQTPAAVNGLTNHATTTALIIPDTTAVVICHSSSLPGALQSQSPLTTVSWYPSFSKLHRSDDNEPDIMDTDNGGYRSVGDPKCCPDLAGKELSQYEHGVLYDSDTGDEDGSDYTDNDYDEDDYDSDNDGGSRKQWFDMKRKLIVQFCESDCFKVSIMTAIFLNTVTMAMEHYRQVCQMLVINALKYCHSDLKFFPITLIQIN